MQIVEKPSQALLNDDNVKTHQDGDVEVVGTMNAQNLPHMRPHCTRYPYQEMGREDYGDVGVGDAAANQRYCPLCYCYVCDVPVDECPEWAYHCQATDQSNFWRQKRKGKRSGVLQARYENAQDFKHIFVVLNKLMTHGCTFECDENGIKMTQMDPAVVCFIDLFLPAIEFEEYSCPRQVRLGMGMDGGLKLMSRILSKARKSDTIVLQASDGVLNVELRNVSRSVPDPVSIPLVDVHHEYQNLGIPEMNNSCLIRMNSGHFKKTVNTMYKSGLSTIALKLQTDKKFIMEDYSHEPNTTRFEFVSGQTLDKTAVSVVCSGEAVEYFLVPATLTILFVQHR